MHCIAWSLTDLFRVWILTGHTASLTSILTNKPSVQIGLAPSKQFLQLPFPTVSTQGPCLATSTDLGECKVSNPCPEVPCGLHCEHQLVPSTAAWAPWVSQESQKWEKTCGRNSLQRSKKLMVEQTCHVHLKCYLLSSSDRGVTVTVTASKVHAMARSRLGGSE